MVQSPAPLNESVLEQTTAHEANPGLPVWGCLKIFLTDERL